MSEEERAFIRQCLMMVLKDGMAAAPQPPFVKNKLCVSLIGLVKIDYPERWPTFFTEFLTLLQASNREHVDCFLRCLKIFDEEIVVFDQDRTREEVDHNTLIKDTIRATVMEQIILTIQGILTGCLEAEGDEGLISVATLGLEVLCEYIGWNDVNLCANQAFITLLYRLMHHKRLRVLAVECMSEVVYKRMFPERKLMLIKHLNIISMLASISDQLPSNPADDEEFVSQVAALLNTLGLQLVHCTDVGRKFYKESTENMNKEINAGGTVLLLQTIEIGFRFLQHNCYVVVDQVNELFCAYVNMLKQGAFTENDAGHAQRIFGCIVNAIKYPEGFSFDKQGDDELAFLQFRNDMNKMFLNLMRGTTYDCLSFIKAHTRVVLEEMSVPNTTISPFRVEAMLQILYSLCEAVKLSNMDNDAEFWNMLVSTITSPYFNNYNLHSQIQIMYFQLCRRYPPVFERHPQIVPGVVTKFIDQRGVNHSHPTVRSQACYLFFKLVAAFSKDLLAMLSSLMDALLAAIQRAISPFFMKLVDQNQSLEGGLDANEVQYMCELLGILVGVNVTKDKCRFYYEAVLRFFMEQLERTLSQKDSWLQDGLRAEVAGASMSHVIDAIGHFSKNLDPSTKKIVIDLMEKPLDSVLMVYMILPKHSTVRASTIFFLHRMTDCLGEQVLPVLPKCLQLLLNHSDPQNLLPFLQLVNQCIIKFKDALIAPMEAMFLAVISTTTECIKSYAYVDGATAAYSSDEQERLLLFKVYYSFLKANVAHFPQILSSERNQPHLHTVLDSVMRGCIHPEDPVVNKSCYGILRLLVKHWEKTGTYTHTAVQHFILQDLTVRMFESVCAPYLNPKDAATAALIREMINLQVLNLKLYKEPYLNRIGEHLISTGWPQAIAQEYCVLLTKGQQKQLRQLISRVMEERAKIAKTQRAQNGT